MRIPAFSSERRCKFCKRLICRTYHFRPANLAEALYHPFLPMDLLKPILYNISCNTEKQPFSGERTMLEFTVGQLHTPTSVAGVLRHYGISATLRRRIKNNGICLRNGIRTELRALVESGDTITVTLPATEAVKPENIPLHIPYEDDYLLAVNKPAGLLMHQTAGERTGTLANAVIYYYKANKLPFSYHPMHRLDRNTSGLCLIAKGAHIQHLFDKKRLFYVRSYMALLEGSFPARQASVRTPIGRDPASIIKRRTDADGKSAGSDFFRLAAAQEYSLVQIALHTGRTHQIRVHSAYLGHPLVGDELYGGKRELLQRQALHAWRLRFVHPVTAEMITVTSPLPADMQRLVDKAGWKL